MVYNPREDSYFLADFVKEHAKGSVLDMCAGTGVQGFAALQNKSVEIVTAVDIDPAALQEIRESPYPITVIESDLFAKLKDVQFDTILCNPPYLPNEEKDADLALYGGPQGYEFTVKFLQDAVPFLKPGGNILLLFSNLTNQERINQSLKDLDYHYEQLGELAMFFERLYVYRIWR